MQRKLVLSNGQVPLLSDKDEAEVNHEQNQAKRMKKSYPSDAKVRCIYPGCGVYVLQRCLNRHEERFHLNQPNRIPHDFFKARGGQGGTRAIQETSPPLQPTASLQSQEGQDDPAPETPGLEDSLPAGDLHENNTSGNQNAAGASGSCSVTSHSKDATPSQSSHPNMDRPDPATKIAADGAFSSSVIAITSRVAAIEANQMKILGLLQKPNEVGTQDTAATDALLNGARDITSIQTATKNVVRCDVEANLLYCETYVPHYPDGVAGKHRIDGVFRYDFSLGTSFSKAEKMPKAPTNMKLVIKQHMSSRTHQRKVEQASRKAAAEELRKADAKSVAIRVLREAFKVLKFSLAHVHFEVNVVSQHRNNVNMGDIGHSAAQMSRFRDAFRDETLATLQRFISKQPCVSLIADKVTLSHRTVDITAVLGVVPEAPVKELIQSFVIAAPVVKDHSGQGIAQEWANSLAEVGVTRPGQLSAICTDGQYHSIGAPKKLIDVMKRSQEDLQEQSRPAAVPVMWDSAHLMELAENAARKDPLCAWVEEVKGDITRISQRFTLASGWERLDDAGTELAIKTLRPKSWSDTRFAPYAGAVLRAFRTNIPAMKAALEKQLRAPETKTSLRVDMQRDLRLLEDHQLHVRIAALQDIYAVIAECSHDLQNVQQLPWERHEACEKLKTFLASQKEAVDVRYKERSHSQKALSTTEIRCHLLQPDPEDLPKWWPNPQKQEHHMEQSQAAEISAFLSALHKQFKMRERGVDARGSSRGCHNAAMKDWVRDIRTAGDLERLSASPSSSISGGVHTAIARLRQSGCIPSTTEVPIPSIASAYRVVREQRQAGVVDNRELFKALHQRSLSQPELQPYVNTVIRMWLSWPIESVVESMASVIGAVFGTRRQLSHQNAAKELVVRWNTPGVFAADELIKAVQNRHRFEFVRKSCDIRTAFEGTVVNRHLRPEQPDRRASVFKRT